MSSNKPSKSTKILYRPADSIPVIGHIFTVRRAYQRLREDRRQQESY